MASFLPIATDVCALLLLGVSAYWNLRYRKIPNWATLPAIVLGLGLNGLFLGWGGMKTSGLGFLVGFGALLVLFVLSWMGGGDVKLMAAVGALKGYPFVVSALLYSLVAGVSSRRYHVDMEPQDTAHVQEPLFRRGLPRLATDSEARHQARRNPEDTFRARHRTRDGLGNDYGLRMESAQVHYPMIRCRRWWRLACDTEGSALLETVIVLPVLMLFMMLTMELCLMANAKQLTNYAAFCAARTASVYGVGSTAKTHLAAAMAMSPISPATPPNASAILSAYGMPDPSQTVRAIYSTPGFQDSLQWSARLADSYVRTSQPICSTSTTPGKTRKHVVVNVTYIYRCYTFPFGNFWGHAGLTAYTNTLKALPFYSVISAVVISLDNSWNWNIPIRGRAVMDYWAG